MSQRIPAPQDLVRKAVVDVAQLPENELLVVIEMMENLKKQRIHPNRESAAKLVAQAKARAAETSRLSRDELMKKFSQTIEAIRADAIAKNTAIEGELEGG
ncbi:MAG: hypothetical protein IT313_07070 [Anaerolineales bacterium]|nr:hypothetical protein [Anaerolineales bacterium]